MAGHVAGTASKLQARMRSDPRFRRPPKAVSKVAVDARFEHMFTDKSFAVHGTVDKYGRKAAPASERGVPSLERLYRRADGAHAAEDEDGADKDDVDEHVAEDDEDAAAEDNDASASASADEEDDEQPRYDPMRGEGVDASSSDEGEWADDIDSDVERDLTEFEQRTLDRIDVPEGEQTRRVAVVNLDWDHVRAQDLLQVLDSFKPPEGSIVSVSVFPSEFGKQRMQQEAQAGPPRQIFKKTVSARDGEGADDDADDDEQRAAGIKHTLGAAENDIDQIELRKYQLERLRYYYAVVECDSVATAVSLYRACDGLEYENSANMIDMRFIPDDESFAELAPRDVATHALQTYEPIPFQTKALQHTNADLTWDDDDPERVRATRRKFTKEDLKTMDFNAYVATSDSDDYEDDEGAAPVVETVAPVAPKPSMGERRAKYRALLEELTPKAQPEQEMEITFTTGLSNVAASLLKKKKAKNAAADKTVWETYLEKRKEKRKERRRQVAKPSEGDSASEASADDENGDDDAADDAAESRTAALAHGSKAKPDRRQRDVEAERRRAAELELLLLDEQARSGKHFHLRELVKAEKLRDKQDKKQAKGSRQSAAADAQRDFAVDVADPRFAAVYNSHLFAIDPSAPQFKKTKGMKAIIDERQRRIQAAPVSSAAPEPSPFSRPAAAAADGRSLSQLVAAVKRKSGTTRAKGKRSKVDV